MKLLGKSVIELKKLLLSKQLKVEELYDYFLNRITKYDNEINSYLSVIVDSSDQVIKNIGNLSGIPVAIKDNFCTQVVRTSETARSIRIPAGWCGVVRLQPSYGRISSSGVMAMGFSWDCPGILDLHVAD